MEATINNIFSPDKLYRAKIEKMILALEGEFAAI